MVIWLQGREAWKRGIPERKQPLTWQTEGSKQLAASFPFPCIQFRYKPLHIHCLFTLLVVSFTVQKLFNLISSHLLTTAIISYATEVQFRKFLSITMSYLFYLPAGYLLYHLDLWHFYFSSIYGDRSESSFGLLYVYSQFSQHYL